jgi:hypothetical protein
MLQKQCAHVGVGPASLIMRGCFDRDVEGALHQREPFAALATRYAGLRVQRVAQNLRQPDVEGQPLSRSGRLDPALICGVSHQQHPGLDRICPGQLR